MSSLVAPSSRSADCANASWVERQRLTRVGLASTLVCAAIVMLPVLVPSGPANTGPVDLVILLALGVLALDSLAYRTVISFPYVIPVVVLVLAGGLAALHRDRALTSGLTLGQDLILLLWGACIATLGRDPTMLRRFLRVWVASAIAWAVVLTMAVNAGLDSVAGITAEGGERASLTFGDPNRAGAYFVTSVLLLAATQWPRPRSLRWACGAVILLAAAYTGSNGAFLGLLAGSILAAVVRYLRNHNWVSLLAILCFVVPPAALVLASVDVAALQQGARNQGRILANSFARSDEGASKRGFLLSENLELFRTHDVVGAGPGGTKALLAGEQAAYVKEAHNDYVASVIERGVVGAIGLVLLWAVVVARCLPLCARSPDPQLTRVIPRPEFLVAAVLATAVFGWFHEALHFRDVWAVLGLVAAASLTQQRRSSDEGGFR